MIVYRMENGIRMGPYRGLPYEEWGAKVTRRNPSPWDDFGNVWQDLKRDHRHLYIFGFRTLVQLRKWFNKTERAKLRKLGFNIVRLEVPELLTCSAKQCAFRRHNVKYLSTAAK